jgi:hypothetical protein
LGYAFTPDGAAMPFPVICANCRTKLTVPDRLAGRRVKCTACGAPLAATAPVPAGERGPVGGERPESAAPHSGGKVWVVVTAAIVLAATFAGGWAAVYLARTGQPGPQRVAVGPTTPQPSPAGQDVPKERAPEEPKAEQAPPGAGKVQEPAKKEEPVLPGHSTFADPLARPVLKQSDFQYLGAFALPREACKVSTAFGEVGLAFRKVGGKLQFLTGAGRPTGDLIYEVSFPGFGKDLTDSGVHLPAATVVKEWGDIYVDRKSGYHAYGLYWDEEAGRLYWSHAPYYNADATNVASLGYTELTDKGPVAHGCWATNSYVQKVRGGCLRIPTYFAEKYTKGRTLALGFGGSYCVIAHGSFGPSLYAVPAPEKEGQTLDALALLNYEADPDKAKAHYCRRDADYRSGILWDKNPVGDDGFWTAADYIHGACCWIDLPDEHGLLVLGSMGHGRLWYGEAEGGGGDKGIHAERSEPWWYVFDPADLAAVAQGKKQPHDPAPSWWKCQETTSSGPAGCCFDPETRTLYVLDPAAWRRKDDVEWYPVIHGYHVK